MHARALTLALAASMLASPAAADSVTGTRSELLVEIRHDIEATVHRGYAELRVRRTVHNGGPRHDQAVFFIDVPPGAVATGLATLGTLGGRPHWFAGELMEAEAAAERYRELTGIGGYYPKDPALLSWRYQGLLALQVFPCPPGEDKSIEYRLMVPTTYERGAHRMSLPALGTAELIATVGARAAAARDKLSIDGKAAAPGLKLKPAHEGSLDFELVPAMDGPLGGELAVVPFAQSKVLTRYAFQAAPRISRAPNGAWVVVAIDTSRSIDSGTLLSQQAAAAAYLSHLPGARVELLLFDRKVRRHYGAFVPAERARRELELLSVPIEQKNGSAVETALLEAERLLAKAPAGQPRRILLFTDGRARSTLRAERLRASLGPSGSIAHLAIVTTGAPRLARDDEHAWAAAPRSTGGLLWRAELSAQREDQQKLRARAEEWARPLRLDHVKLFSPDLPIASAGGETPDSLPEGEGTSELLVADREIAWIRIEGELWSKPASRVLYPEPAHAKRWAALVFGTELMHSLSEPEMMKLAMKGGAVSPVTSYLAIEPGVRPSTEGLDWGSGTGAGFGAGGGRLRMGATRVGSGVPPIDRAALLRSLLESAWRACGGVSGTAYVSFETTLAEVVDVTRVSIRDAKDPLLEPCLREAVWDLALPAAFYEDWNSWTVDV
jgi:hypothetical protein